MGYTVAMVTTYGSEMVKTSQPMIENFVDTIIGAVNDSECQY